jgi:light-regulated signal transduction histidine kinase (bacteriophytochrome)
MFGLAPGTTVHTLNDFLSRVHPSDRPAVRAAAERCIREGTDFDMEFRIGDPGSPERWVYDRGRLFFDDEGRPSYMTGGCLDITARKRVEAVLRRSNEDLRQFAWAASHDLQEPLRVVTAYTQLLERRYADKLDESGVQYVTYAVEAALRMENLLRGMRAYWQASADAEEPALTPVNAEAALDSALNNLAATIADTGAQITRAPLPCVPAQEVQVVQIFQNIIGNALKYRYPDVTPKVHIWAERDDGKWVFSVRDNGIGIAPRHAGQIFGMFKRLHTQKAYAGTGIGLAICQKVVEALGGRIWVESEGEGRGSTFRFTLPALSQPAAPQPVHAAEETPSTIV